MILRQVCLITLLLRIQGRNINDSDIKYFSNTYDENEDDCYNEYEGEQDELDDIDVEIEPDFPEINESLPENESGNPVCNSKRDCGENPACFLSPFCRNLDLDKVFPNETDSPSSTTAVTTEEYDCYGEENLDEEDDSLEFEIDFEKELEMNESLPDETEAPIVCGSPESCKKPACRKLPICQKEDDEKVNHSEIPKEDCPDATTPTPYEENPCADCSRIGCFYHPNCYKKPVKPEPEIGENNFNANNGQEQEEDCLEELDEEPKADEFQPDESIPDFESEPENQDEIPELEYDYDQDQDRSDQDLNQGQDSDDGDCYDDLTTTESTEINSKEIEKVDVVTSQSLLEMDFEDEYRSDFDDQSIFYDYEQTFGNDDEDDDIEILDEKDSIIVKETDKKDEPKVTTTVNKATISCVGIERGTEPTIKVMENISPEDKVSFTKDLNKICQKMQSSSRNRRKGGRTVVVTRTKTKTITVERITVKIRYDSVDKDTGRKTWSSQSSWVMNQQGSKSMSTGKTMSKATSNYSTQSRSTGTINMNQEELQKEMERRFEEMKEKYLNKGQAAMRNNQQQTITINFSTRDTETVQKQTGNFNGNFNENGLEEGFGTKTFTNGIIYTGNFQNGKKSGQGKISYENNKSETCKKNFNGNFKNDQPNGQGVMTYKVNTFGVSTDVTGCVKYEGNFVEGLRHQTSFCNSTCKFAENDLYGRTTYTGCFNNDQITGEGLLIYKDGGMYNGGFKNGQKFGQGTFTYPFRLAPVDKPFLNEFIRRSLSGNFNGHIVTGIATITFNTGEVYKGNVDEKGNMSGQGTKTYTKTDYYKRVSYTGQFQKNLFHGKGKLTWTNGQYYQGDWVKDQKHGYGEYKFKNDDIADRKLFYGKFENDNMIYKNGTWTYNNGDIFQGKLNKYYQKTGQGMLTFNRNSIYEVYSGYFKKSQRWGFGTLIEKSGAKYIGNFEANKMHGSGSYYYPETLQQRFKCYIGKWQNNKFSGFGNFTWNNGDYHIGHFYDGKQNGKGKYVLSENDKLGRDYYEGDWFNGQIDGEVKLVMKDGTYFIKIYDRGTEILDESVKYDRFGVEIDSKEIREMRFREEMEGELEKQMEKKFGKPCDSGDECETVYVTILGNNADDDGPPAGYMTHQTRRMSVGIKQMLQKELDHRLVDGSTEVSDEARPSRGKKLEKYDSNEHFED